jgi:ankyrin repeat protein
MRKVIIMETVDTLKLWMRRKSWKLFQAIVQQNDYKFKKYSMDPKIDLNRPVDSQGNTVLHAAVNAEKYSYVEDLVVGGRVSLNQRNSEGATPLMTAFTKGADSIAKYLLQQKDINPHMRDNKNNTVLHKAAASGSTTLVRLLFDEGEKLFHQKSTLPDQEDSLNAKNNDGQTALHMAVQHPELLKHLLEDKGFDLNLMDKKGNTPLMQAVCSGNYESCKILLKEGERINPNLPETPNSHKTPLWEAMRIRHWKIFKELLEHPKIDPNRPWVMSNIVQDTRRNTNHSANLEMLKALLDHPKIKPNKVDNSSSKQQTTLHKAVCCDKTLQDKVINALLKDPRTNPNLKDEDGNTPAHLVVKKGSPSMVDLLLKNREVWVRWDREDDSLYSAINAAVSGFPAKEQTTGCDFTVSNQRGEFFATPKGLEGELLQKIPINETDHPEAYAQIDKHVCRIDWNLKNNDGNTPAHLAAKSRSRRKFRSLHGNKDIDWGVPNNKHRTAMDIARSNIWLMGLAASAVEVKEDATLPPYSKKDPNKKDSNKKDSKELEKSYADANTAMSKKENATGPAPAVHAVSLGDRLRDVSIPRTKSRKDFGKVLTVARDGVSSVAQASSGATVQALRRLRSLVVPSQNPVLRTSGRESSVKGKESSVTAMTR